MFFVIFDPNLKEQVIQTYLREKQLVENLYQQFIKILDGILADEKLPAQFASFVFFGEPSNEAPMALRVVAALYDLLLKTCKLPLFVSFGDLDLGEEGIIRLIYVFSRASKVEGLPGRVIVAQFSDGDELITVNYSKGAFKLTSLRGALAFFVTLSRLMNREPLQCFEKFKRQVTMIISKIKG